MHSNHFRDGSGNFCLYLAADFQDIDAVVQDQVYVGEDFVFLDFQPNTFICPAASSRFAVRGIIAILLTPGTSNAVRRAIVTKTSGAMVVLPIVR